MKRQQIRYLDSLWSKLVKLLWNNRCARCGSQENLTSHHIIGKRNFKVRWYLENGICLCLGCHRWGHDDVAKLNEFVSRRVKPNVLARLRVHSLGKYKPLYDDVLKYLKKALDKF